MKRIEIIKIDWNDLKSIKVGERKKSHLENLGYSLVSTIAGLNLSKLIYKQ